MKKLLYKEYKLTVIPLVYAFFSFVAMLFIPSYPYTVTFFYTTLSIFFCILTAREEKDFVYMSTLPLPKKDMVTARYAMVISIELLQLVICIPFCIIRCAFLTYDNIAGIEANIAFIGLALVQFAIFNTTFLGFYFRNVNNLGISFLISSIIEAIVIIAIEASVHVAKAVSGSCFWDEKSGHALFEQIPILIVGVLFFIVVNGISYRRDIKNFIRQDL